MRRSAAHTFFFSKSSPADGAGCNAYIASTTHYCCDPGDLLTSSSREDGFSCCSRCFASDFAGGESVSGSILATNGYDEYMFCPTNVCPQEAPGRLLTPPVARESVCSQRRDVTLRHALYPSTSGAVALLRILAAMQPAAELVGDSPLLPLLPLVHPKLGII